MPFAKIEDEWGLVSHFSLATLQTNELLMVWVWWNTIGATIAHWNIDCEVEWKVTGISIYAWIQFNVFLNDNALRIVLLTVSNIISNYVANDFSYI